jgi:aspartyl/asparaginyl beta-hydroxylase (cupin superfamily)
VFYVFGERFEPNCTRCPDTVRLLDRTPHIRNAWFSILVPTGDTGHKSMPLWPPVVYTAFFFIPGH